LNIGRHFLKLAKSIVDRFPKVALIYRYLRDSHKLMQEPKETKMGFKFIGNRAMEQGMYEPEDTKITVRLLQNADVFVNVGANIGYYCCIALKCGIFTVAFEPVELNLKYLFKNIKANNWVDSIEVFPLALSNKAGLINIYGGGSGASLVKGWARTPEQYVKLVPTSTMDYILSSRFNGKSLFILVDIEGAEKSMLEGANSILNREPRPIWMVEITISKHQPEGIKINPNLLSTFEIFWDKGYEAWTAGNRIRNINSEEIESIIKNGTDTILTDNFLFIEKGKKDELLNTR